MLIIIMEVITIIQLLITHILHQLPKDCRVKTPALTHSHAVLSIGIAFHASLSSTLLLQNVTHINSVIRKMENLNVIHVPNMVKHAKDAI